MKFIISILIRIIIFLVVFYMLYKISGGVTSCDFKETYCYNQSLFKLSLISCISLFCAVPHILYIRGNMK